MDKHARLVIREAQDALAWAEQFQAMQEADTVGRDPRFSHGWWLLPAVILGLALIVAGAVGVAG